MIFLPHLILIRGQGEVNLLLSVLGAAAGDLCLPAGFKHLLPVLIIYRMHCVSEKCMEIYVNSIYTNICFLENKGFGYKLTCIALQFLARFVFYDDAKCLPYTLRQLFWNTVPSFSLYLCCIYYSITCFFVQTSHRNLHWVRHEDL